jgi:hypothetical protein
MMLSSVFYLRSLEKRRDSLNPQWELDDEFSSVWLIVLNSYEPIMIAYNGTRYGQS